MKKTHKRILGLAGIGIVAATTAVAAALPSPIAAALSAATDTIQVTVVSANPDLVATSSSAPEITSPEYTFTVTYNHLISGQATITNYDKDGNIKFSAQIWDESLDGSAGRKDFSLNLDDYGGVGNFVITINGTGNDGVVLEQVLSVVYKAEEKEEEVTPGEGESDVDIDVDIPTDKVSSVTVNIYDENGNLVGTIDIDNPSDVENLDLSGLGDGTYTLEIITKDSKGDIVDIITIIVVVDTTGTGGSVPVKIEDQEKEIGKVVITVKDEDGNTVKTIVVDDPVPGSIVDVDFSDLDAGEYTIIVDYYDKDGNKINTTTEIVIKSDEDGKVNIDIEKVVDSVTLIEASIYDENGNLVRVIKADRETGTVYVYDADGNLLFVVENGYKDGKFNISLEGLPYGDYTAVIVYKNARGKIIGEAKTVKIKYRGKAIVVPDTGSFFQGLNISREDYLITGAIVFTVIGIVAFGIVKKNRSSKNVRINGKNRR